MMLLDHHKAVRDRKVIRVDKPTKPIIYRGGEVISIAGLHFANVAIQRILPMVLECWVRQALELACCNTLRATSFLYSTGIESKHKYLSQDSKPSKILSSSIKLFISKFAGEASFNHFINSSRGKPFKFITCNEIMP